MTLLRASGLSTVLMVVPLVGAVPSWGWTAQGHRLITRAAVESLDGVNLPLDDRHRAAIVDASVQPDLMRPQELPELRGIEAPRHFIDLELLQGEELPEELSQYLRLLIRLSDSKNGLGGKEGDFTSVGLAPYALVESTQRLAVAFAQLRRDSADEGLQSMVSYLAGQVAHYAQDLCQPLHTTIHHDGVARANGSSPHTGIHLAVDDVLRRADLPTVTASSRSPRKRSKLFRAVVEELADSHSLVGEVYEMTADLQKLQASGKINPRLDGFARERYLRASAFTADLILTAWKKSASIALPSWANEKRPAAPPSD